MIQTVYCYTGKVKEKGTPLFTDREIKEGLDIKWLSSEESIEIIEQNPDGFTKTRALLLLEEYKKSL